MSINSDDNRIKNDNDTENDHNTNINSTDYITTHKNNNTAMI